MTSVDQPADAVVHQVRSRGREAPAKRQVECSATRKAHGAMIRALVSAAYTKALQNPDVTPDSGVMHQRVAAPCDAHWRSSGLRRSTGRAVCSATKSVLPRRPGARRQRRLRPPYQKRAVAVLILPVDASHLLQSTHRRSAKIGTAWAALSTAYRFAVVHFPAPGN
jgi:hypothetical protein